MTELTKDRLKDVALAAVTLPFALILSPLLVLWWYWDTVTDCWEAHASRHSRNEWLRKSAAVHSCSIPGCELDESSES